jgi:hypothetical protein
MAASLSNIHTPVEPASQQIESRRTQIKSHTPPFLIFIFCSVGARENSGSLAAWRHRARILYYLRIALARITNAQESKVRRSEHACIAGSVPLSCRARIHPAEREKHKRRAHMHRTDLSSISSFLPHFCFTHSETHVSNF